MVGGHGAGEVGECAGGVEGEFVLGVRQREGFGVDPAAGAEEGEVGGVGEGRARREALEV